MALLAPAGAVAQSPRVELDLSGTRISYRIRRGDTLAGIASQFGTTVRDLQHWNGLRGSRIVAGATLTIYTQRGF